MKKPTGMRRLIVSMNVSLDGFMAGANCELDWHFSYWNQEMAMVLCEQLAEADTILLGRITYEAMACYWPGRAAQLAFPGDDLAFANLMNNHEKIVFSRTLTRAEWQHTKIVRGHIPTETARLKGTEGKHIMVYGSGQLVNLLMESGLIDEYRLWVHPVVLRQGRPFFSGQQASQRMQLLRIRAFPSGVALLCYAAGPSGDRGRLPSI